MILYGYAIILVLLNTVSLASIPLGLPGNWFMVILTWLLAWWQWDKHVFSLPVLIAIIVLAAFGEVMEFLTGALAVKKVGGSRRGAVGAILGALVFGLVGTFVIPIPIVGSLIGACVGAFLGAWGLELSGGKNMDDSLRSGLGAGLGRFLGLNIKLLAGITIWLIVGVSAFWP
jgi:uncharacterized protein